MYCKKKGEAVALCKVALYPPVWDKLLGKSGYEIKINGPTKNAIGISALIGGKRMLFVRLSLHLMESVDGMSLGLFRDMGILDRGFQACSDALGTLSMLFFGYC